MVDYGTRLVASIVVESSASAFGKAVTDHWRPTVEYRGDLYPGAIIECKTPIAPGCTGDIVLDLIHSNDLNIKPGDNLALVEGDNLIATGTVLELR